ncbi:Dabb family protein [Marisediminicola sp. LYQ85]|uniref:Dabb family protein n=1 Tax=Marisediminicola sp. LYQ85 TaxID=3391062 RepID=UPI0039838014
MIRHIICWKLAATDPAQRAEDASVISSELNGLVSLIPEISSLTVSTNAVDIDGNWDLALVIDFADEAALRVYGPHPEHQRVVEIVKPRVSERSAIDILV